MSKALIIGCGGVASVAIHKCCQNSEVFEGIMIASRTKSKCDALKEKLAPTTKTVIETAQVNADNVDELIALIESYKPALLPRPTTSIPRITSLRTPLSLSTSGSGLTARSLKKRASQRCWAAALTPALRAFSRHTL